MKPMLIDPALSSELANIAKEAAYVVTLDLFANHPEVEGILWMNRVPIRNWESDVVLIQTQENGFHKVVDDECLDHKFEQDVTVPYVLIQRQLAMGMAIPHLLFSHPSSTWEEHKDNLAIVHVNDMKHKISAIATHVYEIFSTLVDLKVSFNEAWNEGVRILVYRVPAHMFDDGRTIHVNVTQQQDRDISYHEGISQVGRE